MKNKKVKVVVVLFLMSISMITKAQNMDVKIKSKKEVFAELSKSCPQIEPKDLMDKMNAKQSFILLDVRTERERNAGYISGSIWMPRTLLEVKIQKLGKDPNAEIIVYCSLGGVSLLTVKTLNELGYKNVYSIKGGMKSWVQQGYTLYNLFGEINVLNFMKRDPNLSTYDIFRE